MTLICLVLFYTDGTRWAALKPDIFHVYELHNIASPTAILRVDNDIFLGADHLAPRPGLYRLSLVPGAGYQASLLKMLPQEVVEGLQLMENGEVMVVSERKFTARPEDWVGQLITLELEQYRLTSVVELLEPDNICSDGTRDCGLADLVFLSENQILAFTKKGVAKAHLLNRDGTGWALQKSVPVFAGGKAVTISEVKRIEGRIVCLLKNRWMLAACLPESVMAEGSWKLELEPVFDFSPIRKKFGIEDPTYYFYGLAEGFDFDPSGNLMVVLNNRGYAFRKSPDGKTGQLPKLLIFPKDGQAGSAEPGASQNGENHKPKNGNL